MTSYRIGIDTGGTFTDLIAFNVETGEIHSLKVASTPREPLQAFIGAIRESGVEAGQIDGLVHGTTVATNTLIQRNGAKVAFVTTAGFEDIPYIQRVNRRELYNLEWDKPQPLLRSRRHCFGVNERISAKGQAVKPLKKKEIEALCEQIRAGGFEAVAVCLLFAYLNTEHEQALKRGLQQRLNGLPVSISHEVAPIWREYERSSTTIADAYLKPLLQRYVGSLQHGLDAEGIDIHWALMKSNGGIMQAAAAVASPIHLATSGPAGGMVASQYMANLLGLKDVVTIDVGGTSADVGIIVDGALHHTTEFEIEWGIPAAIPIIDLKTIGAGGGSMAWINAGGFLQVGPQSAGADPGPVCYGQGGTEPTLTDANLVLGRLDPDYFLGGKMQLQTDLARQRLSEMAVKLGMETIELAHAIVDIANENMANAIRMVSIERGHDPRRFALIAFGGAGPLHGAAIARKLDIPTVVAPPFPGAFSALGLLMADLRVDKIWTQAFRSDLVSLGAVESQFQQIAEAALTELQQQGYQGEPQLHYAINMRYLGQNYETEIELPDSLPDIHPHVGADLASALGDRKVSPLLPGFESFETSRKLQASGKIDFLAEAYEAFHRMHEATYGYRIPTAVIELISFKVTAIGATPMPQIGKIQAVEFAPPRERSVYFAGYGFLPCRLIRRSAVPVRTIGRAADCRGGRFNHAGRAGHKNLTRNEYDILILDVAGGV
ncbi:MAG: hydantoinase/oxoprolinase family protein [Anaerolineae bacterium]